jgi:hypothetical protein
MRKTATSPFKKSLKPEPINQYIPKEHMEQF